VAFVADVTVPDGTTISSTERFTKTWRFQNAGTCTWTSAYRFVFVSGDQMGAPASIPMPRIVTPGETVDISIDLTAPETAGTYKGVWSFEDHTGKRFGLGNNSTGEIWVQVTVIQAPTSTATLTPVPTQTSTPTPAPAFISGAEILAYDFIAEACAAEWTINGTQMACPGSVEGGQTSIVAPILEDGSEPGFKSIRIDPSAANDTLTATYPEYLVQPGDQFRALVSCAEGAAACSALFRLSAQDVSSGAITDLWAVGEFQDQRYTEVNVDLSALADHQVRIVLSVTMLSDDPGNVVFWVAPGIYRLPQPTATVTLTPTVTATTSPTVTATSVPATQTATPAPATPKTPPTLWESIQQFFDELFKSLFGG
jgi:hypothetical protein